MSHEAQLQFVSALKVNFPSYFKGKRVLECGSCNINGSVRSFFHDCYYLGIDVVPGPDVDIVKKASEFKSSELFDVVISCEMLEHDPQWPESLANMYRLLRSGGLMIVTCAAPGRPEHGTTRTSPGDSPSCQLWGDYYQNLGKQDVMGTFQEHMFDAYDCHEHNNDLYFWGFKA
jgi:SAM-dependent methyltransferase